MRLVRLVGSEAKTSGSRALLLLLIGPVLRLILMLLLGRLLLLLLLILLRVALLRRRVLGIALLRLTQPPRRRGERMTVVRSHLACG